MGVFGRLLARAGGLYRNVAYQAIQYGVRLGLREETASRIATNILGLSRYSPEIQHLLGVQENIADAAALFNRAVGTALLSQMNIPQSAYNLRYGIEIVVRVYGTGPSGLPIARTMTVGLDGDDVSIDSIRDRAVEIARDNYDEVIHSARTQFLQVGQAANENFGSGDGSYINHRGETVTPRT